MASQPPAECIQAEGGARVKEKSTVLYAGRLGYRIYFKSRVQVAISSFKFEFPVSVTFEPTTRGVAGKSVHSAS